MPTSRKPHRKNPIRSEALLRHARAATFKTPSQRAASRASKPRPSVAQETPFGSRFEVKVPLPGHDVVLTRRHFLLGAAGIGAVAAATAGVVLLGGGEEESDSQGITVPERAVFNIDDCEELPRDDCFTLVGDYELPFGTLVWANNSQVAACLLPTETASPLTQVALLMLDTGNYFTVLEAAVGAAEGFEIYDARASQSGLVWIEANIMEGIWRILCAPISSEGSLGEPRLLEEGDRSCETPSIGAVKDNAYWQVMPSTIDEEFRTKPSYLKRAGFAKDNIQVLHEATGRMSCPLYPSDAGVVIAAHNPESRSTYDLMYFDDESGLPMDTLTLPSGMAPNALGFGPNGIAFCFESIYDYGDGISNLGTYTPATAHVPGSPYNDIKWFRFGRTPQTGPCWCTDRWLMVKSTTAVCGVDLANHTFCSLDVESGCTNWGDHLATTGAGDTVVTIMQIDQVNTKGKTEHRAQVRVWKVYDGPAHVDEDEDGYDDITGELLPTVEEQA